MAWLKKNQVADFFLNEEHVYSKTRTVKITHVCLVLGVLVMFVFILGAYYDNKAQRAATLNEIKKEAQGTPPSNRAIVEKTSNSGGYLSLPSSFAGFSGAHPSTRQRSASQIIKRGENAADVLPMGSGIGIELIGRVESTDANSPVQARIMEDVLSPVEAMVIPKGSKVIGTGQLDVNRERLQVHFSTLVLPDGQEFGISGLAAMPDGSSGLAGNFSSGAIKRNASQFIGTFIGGLAEGMKDRTAVGGLGIPFEPGGIRNGLLNGVVESTSNYAKTQTEQMGEARGSISVAGGLRFVLFLDREFHQ